QKAEKRGPVKLTKKQKKLLKDNHRQLDSRERYRALTDVLDEALDLVDLADHKARFALIIMTAINAVIFLLGARTDAIKDLPEGVRPWILVGFIFYILTALYFFAGGAPAGFGKDVKFKGKSAQTSGEASSPARDWKEHPALVERTTSAEVVGLGDVHGGYDRLVSLLTAAGLIKSDGQSRGGYAWAGGKRVLVSVGDLIN